jgi:hypothetical protein
MPALRDMTAAELRDRMTRIRELNPHTFERLQSYRNTQSALRRRLAADEAQRLQDYRAQVRETMQAFSDQALASQSARIIGGVDREECDRELARRRAV